MLTRILVPLDGSALAERALTVAARLARTTDATLLVLQVYPGMIGETTPELVAYSETADARAARAYLERVRLWSVCASDQTCMALRSKRWH